MSDQVFSAPELGLHYRIKCTECGWQGETREAKTKGRPVPEWKENYEGATGYHCPKCDTLVAILGGYGLLPTTKAEVTFPPGIEKDIVHMPPK